MKPLAQCHSIKEGWETYLDSVIPAEASEYQKRDTQIAFYAGAILVNDLFMRLGDGPVNPIASMEAIKALQDELREYRELVARDFAETTP